jgi:hypothetical protein
MIRAKMALAAGSGQSSEFDRRSVASMASGAIANRAIFVRAPNAVAGQATTFDCRDAFQKRECMRGTFYATRLELFGKGDLFGREILVTRDGSPGGRGMTAVKKLLVYGFVAGPAIGGCGAIINDKTVVVFALLTCDDLVAIEAVYALARVDAHLELVNNRVCSIQVALRAFAGSLHESGGRLLEFGAWASRMEEIRGDNESGGDDNCDEYSAKSHEPNLWRTRRNVKWGNCALMETIDFVIWKQVETQRSCGREKEANMKLFARNIDRTGRIVRAIWGVVLIGAGLLLWRAGSWFCFVLVVAGGFALFEAVRGWCIARACGIKTRW